MLNTNIKHSSSSQLRARERRRRIRKSLEGFLAYDRRTRSNPDLKTKDSKGTLVPKMEFRKKIYSL